MKLGSYMVLGLLLAVIVVQAQTTEFDGNLLVNPSFEKDFEGWGQWGAHAGETEVLLAPDDAAHGRRVLNLKQSEENDLGMAWQRVDGKFEWDETVYAEVRVKRVSGTSGEPFITICIKDRSSYEYISGNMKTGHGSSGWEKLSVKYKVPPGTEIPDLEAVHIELNIGIMHGGPDDVFFFDDVYVGRKRRIRASKH